MMGALPQLDICPNVLVAVLASQSAAAQRPVRISSKALGKYRASGTRQEMVATITSAGLRRAEQGVSGVGPRACSRVPCSGENRLVRLC